VLKLKKPKTAALHVGNSVHSALKAWNKARWLDKPLTLKGLHDEFTKAWADTSEGLVNWEPGEEDEEKTTGWRLCDTYIRQSGSMANIKPDAVEVSIEADLTQHGLPRLIGILDLVQEGSIIDFKTSSSTPNPSSVEHLHETQTSSYAVLYRHNTGKKETGIELHHLVKNKSPKLCITDMPPMTDQQQSRLFHSWMFIRTSWAKDNSTHHQVLAAWAASSSVNADAGIKSKPQPHPLHMKHLILIICLLCCSPQQTPSGLSPVRPIQSLNTRKRSSLWKATSPHKPSFSTAGKSPPVLWVSAVSSSSSSAPHLEPQPANTTMQHHEDWDQHPHHPQSSTAANPTSWAKRAKKHVHSTLAA
jgi:putative RecB family exonuclease